MLRSPSVGTAAHPKPQVRKPVVKPATGVTVHDAQADLMDGGNITLKIAEAFESVVRKELTDAGHWIGAVVTDDAGMATVNIRMPTKTTKWRLTARGCTVDTLVGQIRVNTITRKDFFLDLKIPPIVTEGDQIRVHGRLHNRTEFEGATEVKLKVNVNGRQTILPKTVTMKRRDITDFIFDPISIPVGDTDTKQPSAPWRGLPAGPRMLPEDNFNRWLWLSATANAGTMTDEVSRDIPIRPWG